MLNGYSSVQEGRTIQKRLTRYKSRNEADISRIFAKLMIEGKVSAAIKFLSNNSDSGVLPASEKVLQELNLRSKGTFGTYAIMT